MYRDIGPYLAVVLCLGVSGCETHVCIEEATQCSDRTFQKCVNGAWANEACTYGCDPTDGCFGVCAPGNTECVGQTSEHTCNEAYQWGDAVECTDGCDNTTGECKDGASCTDGATKCSDHKFRKCVEGAWTVEEACKYACNETSGCYGVCKPNDTECVDRTSEHTCNEECEWGEAQECAHGCDDDTGKCLQYDGDSPPVIMPPAPPGGGKWNVLMIVVDDLNNWVTHLNGHPNARTPHIDRLAAQGMTFAHAYSPVPACNPTRAATLVGVRPWTSGVYWNRHPWHPILGDQVSLPQHFKGNGYKVLGTGKIFHGTGSDRPGYSSEYWTRYQDFDGSEGGPERLNGVSGVSDNMDWGPLDVGDDQMADYKRATWVVERLGNQHEKPFFIAVGFQKPHLEWKVPRHYFERFPLGDIVLPVTVSGDLDDVPPPGVNMAKPNKDHAHIVSAGKWKQAVQAYLATMAFVDEQIGRVLTALEQSAYNENTIVVLWSDHGWHLGEKEHWRKFALWEEANHIPFIVSVPGFTPVGSVCDYPIDMMSLYPTLVELTGLPAVETEGVSLLRLLHGPQSPWEHPAVMTYGRGNHAVRTARWRYIRYDNGDEELYDHDVDPHEWTNLAGNPSTASIREELRQWLPESEAPNAHEKIAFVDGENADDYDYDE